MALFEGETMSDFYFVLSIIAIVAVMIYLGILLVRLRNLLIETLPDALSGTIIENTNSQIIADKSENIDGKESSKLSYNNNDVSQLIITEEFSRESEDLIPV